MNLNMRYYILGILTVLLILMMVNVRIDRPDNSAYKESKVTPKICEDDGYVYLIVKIFRRDSLVKVIKHNGFGNAHLTCEQYIKETL